MEENRLINKIAPLLIIITFVFGVSLFNQNKTVTTELLRISFLNVGQGDSILITTPEKKNYLIDGGPDRTVLNELGKVMPPTKELEAVILTHPHADHVAGLNYVLESHNVKNVYITGAEHTSNDYLEFLSLIDEKDIATHKLTQNEEINTPGVSIKSIWPNNDIFYTDLNQTSIVLLITYKENRILLLGDLPEKEQELILKNIQTPIDVIKVAHHGSKTGLSENLLLKTNPKYAVISVGKNGFGHPSLTTLNRLRNQIILRTDQKGTIDISLTGKDIYVTNLL